MNTGEETGERLSGLGIRSPKELKKAARQSLSGFLSVLRGEKSFRTDVVAFAASAVLALAIPSLTLCERALMIYVAFMPLVAELVNTAIEKTVDRISRDQHVLSGLAKDIGSSIVTASFVGAGLCWAVILIGHGWTAFCR